MHLFQGYEEQEQKTDFSSVNPATFETIYPAALMDCHQRWVDMVGSALS